MVFQPFPKIPRLKRDIVITEKIDGTNAQIGIIEASHPFPVGTYVPDESDGALCQIEYAGAHYLIYAGSRNRWLTIDNDNYGFARWVLEHAEELTIGLGEGRHYGEWWGKGIQRRYGLQENRFSLFNVHRWSDENVRPSCCRVVPVMYEGIHDDNAISTALWSLGGGGSIAAPGFMQPEGIVVYHTMSRQLYKLTLDGDHK